LNTEQASTPHEQKLIPATGMRIQTLTSTPSPLEVHVVEGDHATPQNHASTSNYEATSKMITTTPFVETPVECVDWRDNLSPDSPDSSTLSQRSNPHAKRRADASLLRLPPPQQILEMGDNKNHDDNHEKDDDDDDTHGLHDMKSDETKNNQIETVEAGSKPPRDPDHNDGKNDSTLLNDEYHDNGKDDKIHLDDGVAVAQSLLIPGNISLRKDRRRRRRRESLHLPIEDVLVATLSTSPPGSEGNTASPLMLDLNESNGLSDQRQASSRSSEAPSHTMSMTLCAVEEEKSDEDYNQDLNDKEEDNTLKRQIESLLVEKKSLQDRLFRMTKDYEMRVTPFRDTFEEVRNMSVWNLSSRSISSLNNCYDCCT
jgi:hypothetical protein